MVEALVSAVRAAFPRLSHRYYAMKAKWLGKERLEYWDRNAPLPKVEQRHVDWDEARDTVLSAYGGFSPKMADIARRFFDERWIDAPVRPGKAPGAFSHPTVPSVHPYVLLNYQGKPRDVMTLAHELGHGVHQVLAAQAGRADGGDAADARGDGVGVRRNADLSRAAGEDFGAGSEEGDARPEGRGHAQHGRAPDRLLYVRAQGPHRAQARRAHGGAFGRNLDGGAGRKSRARDPSRSPATRRSGLMSVISFTRRSTSMPMRSAIAW